MIKQNRKMTKLNNFQYLGIGLVFLGFSTPFLIENNFFESLSGITAAIGVSLILKWFPISKKNKINIGTKQSTKGNIG